MALFEGSKRIEGTRSNTHLVKSGHMSPAEDWLLDPYFMDKEMSSVFNDGVLLKYQYIVINTTCYNISRIDRRNYYECKN